MNASIVSSICFVICFVAFVGGCTSVFNADTAGKQMRDCLATQSQWINGDCVKEVK